MIPLQPGVAQRVGRGIAPLFHDRGTSGGQQHAPVALYPREGPDTHFTGGCVGLMAGLDGRKISSPTGNRPRTVQPAASHTPTELPGPYTR